MAGISDEEFRAKLEAHFAVYRLNLRYPLIANVVPGAWYRVDLILVNELGLFRRADMVPDGEVELDCQLLEPAYESLAPLQQDNQWCITVRPASLWENDRIEAAQEGTVAGFHGSGKGAFEYMIQAKKGSTSSSSLVGGPRYLCVRAARWKKFASHITDITILPLVLGPIQLDPSLTLDTTTLTQRPTEQWPEFTAMVHQGYRLFLQDTDNTAGPTNTAIRANNVVIEESWDAGIPGKIWDSALVMLQLVERLVSHQAYKLVNQHVVDLSAGTGLLGLAMASFCRTQQRYVPCQVTITELDEALPLIQKNVSLHHTLKENVSVKPLLWGNTEQAKACGKADIVLASDVLYEAEFFEDLVKSFVDLSTPHTRIFIGYKRRGFNAAEETRFWDLCSVHFHITQLRPPTKTDTDDDDDDDAILVPSLAEATGVQIYRLSRK
ncbi:putative methyltransferase-domain-containing protein [Radiomyces spectabilis]|uniref:putative methyltransferase-domain-containing protein n=1 Tax=Radiomyces spectabilis TaxID=64574 RepID=UPI0022203B1E|nr:putative methyltransferase-domain-containing protein [Radiomyces spectabilis]KAI8365975.1 putative methyltransferase-domain-containing protein [Radiomyces spectabilis]